MAYDDTIPLDQGAPKLSEVAIDRVQEVLAIVENGNALAMVEQLRRLSIDALRRQNYILHSNGEISWNGSEIRFDANGRANHIIFRILQTELGVDLGSIRMVDLRLNGSISGNTTTTFENITLNDQELLYLEIDTNRIRNSAPSGQIVIENSVGGGSLNSGYTLKKVALTATTAMPQLSYPLPSELTSSVFPTTFFVPLCFRADWNDGTTTYRDLWWIPHGIKWPEGVVSTIGDVIVRGLETYGDYYVRTQAELQTAITALSSIGGNIIVSAPFTIDTTITIPVGVRLMGRSSRGTGSPRAVLTFAAGGQIEMLERSQIKDIHCVCSAYFASGIPEVMFLVSGNYCVFDGVSFDFQNIPPSPVLSSNAIGIRIGNLSPSSNNLIHMCRFQNCAAFGYRTGINFNSGSNSIELYSEYT